MPPIKIIVIDDDRADRLAIRKALSKSGLQVTIDEVYQCSTGKEQLKNNKYDCAIVDYCLPDGDGLELVRSVRDVGIDTPIIVLTGQGDEELVVDMIKSGASDYITKDKMSPEILSKSICSVIKIYKAEEERKIVEKKLIQSNETIVDILESITEAFFSVTSNWEFTYVNRQAESMFGVERDDLVGKNMWDVLPESQECIREVLEQAMKHNAVIHVDQYYDTRDLWFELHIFPEKSGGLAVYAQDISARKVAECRLNFLATHDELTELPNRSMMIANLNKAMSQSDKNKSSVAILFIDLDRFKDVNDSFGHKIGDSLIKSVAQRIRGCVKSSDTVARMGGDEFLVILSNMSSLEEAGAVAERLRLELTTYFEIKGNTIFPHASIGLSYYPSDGDNAESLITHADTAMYHAKAEGKNRIKVYSRSMDIKAIERLSLEAGLRRAINREEFILFYQPIYDATTENIVSAEALIRWENPKQGLLVPEKFLHVAEEVGIIGMIDDWVLDTIINQRLYWKNIGLKDLQLSVNISNCEITRHNFINKLVSLLDKIDFTSRWLEIELTENYVVDNIEFSSHILQKIGDMGINVALDDFGTGNSSLENLKHLPIKSIKIDQSFISGLETESKDRAIVSAIIDLAHGLGLRTIAEGVETNFQADFLKDLHCDLLQGNLYCQPLDARDFEKFVKSSWGIDKKSSSA